MFAIVALVPSCALREGQSSRRCHRTEIVGKLQRGLKGVERRKEPVTSAWTASSKQQAAASQQQTASKQQAVTLTQQLSLPPPPPPLLVSFSSSPLFSYILDVGTELTCNSRHSSTHILVRRTPFSCSPPPPPNQTTAPDTAIKSTEKCQKYRSRRHVADSNCAPCVRL